MVLVILLKFSFPFPSVMFGFYCGEGERKGGREGKS